MSISHAASGGNTIAYAGDGNLTITQHYVARPDLPLYVAVPALPAYVVGREEIVADLVRRLCGGETTAVSTAGQPGVGKTTLATLLAHHATILAHFTDGVLWAALGPQADLIAIQNRWADALNLSLSDLPHLSERAVRINQAIGQRRLLLVIDDAWSLEAAECLRCPNPHVTHLLTTRDEALARGFAQTQQSLHLAVLAEQPSVQLLRQLAPEAWQADAQQVRRLALAVGGLPLSLELMAGYLSGGAKRRFAHSRQQALHDLLSPAHRLQLTTIRLGDLSRRRVSLQETIELSLEALAEESPTARTAFYALGAFAAKPAHFDLAAALAVSETDEETLALLIDRNLLELVEDVSPTAKSTPDSHDQSKIQNPKLVLSETNVSKIPLSLHQELAAVARTQTAAQSVTRQRDYYLAIVNQDREDWQQIAPHHAQLQQAWQAAPDEALLPLFHALGHYQRRRGYLPERIEWAQRLLPNVKANQQTSEEAVLYTNLGYCYASLGEKAKALGYYEQALPLRRQVGDVGGEATTLNNIGGVYDSLGEKAKALGYYEQALPLMRQVGDRWGESVTRFNMAMVYEHVGRLVEAEAELQRVVALDEVLHHPDLASDRAALARVQQRIQLLDKVSGHILPGSARS